MHRRSPDWVLFQSRYRAASHFRFASDVPGRSDRSVSISLSSGFSFQGRRPPWPPAGLESFNLVIERLLISGQDKGKLKTSLSMRFNLVIERLLISGQNGSDLNAYQQVSISLSSGFSFQASGENAIPAHGESFNLVIERLLISGKRIGRSS